MIYQGSQKHTGFQALRGYLDSARTVKWTSLTHINIIAVPTVGDVNGDGLNEVLVIGSDTLFVLRGSDGSLLWKKYLGGHEGSTPAIYDIDGDDSVEIVIGKYGSVWALKGTDGNVKWSYALPGHVFNSPVIGDVNNDGYTDVVILSTWGIVGLDTSRMFVIRGDGTPIYQVDAPTIALYSYASPLLGDLNGDGYKEIITVYSDEDAGGGVACAYDGPSGTNIWCSTMGFPLTYMGASSSPVITDANNDGNPDVIVSEAYSNLYIFRGSDGYTLFSLSGAGRNTPASWDIDNDGNREIIVPGVRAYRNGMLIWYQNLQQDWPDGIKIADVSNSSMGLEIVVSVDTGLFVLSSSGSILWRERPITTIKNSSVADVDGDGCSEIVVVGRGVAIIDAPASACGYVWVSEGITKPKKGNLRIYNILGAEVEGFKGKGVYFVKEGGRVYKVLKR
ncbi:MAG: FG-GAP-like repeat-containing protein [candidate division WOR-3 bacterium]